MNIHNSKKIIELTEGQKFMLAGGKKQYEFIAFICHDDKELKRGLAFMKDQNGKERHQKMFPFTRVKI